MSVMPKRRPRPVPERKASDPVPLNVAQASAVQMLSQGKADEAQQKTALNWIINEACGLPLWPYRESPRETDLALGRHFVAQQIVGALRVNMATLRERSK